MPLRQPSFLCHCMGICLSPAATVRWHILLYLIIFASLPPSPSFMQRCVLLRYSTGSGRFVVACARSNSGLFVVVAITAPAMFRALYSQRDDSPPCRCMQPCCALLLIWQQHPCLLAYSVMYAAVWRAPRSGAQRDRASLLAAP